MDVRQSTALQKKKMIAVELKALTTKQLVGKECLLITGSFRNHMHRIPLPLLPLLLLLHRHHCILHTAWGHLSVGSLHHGLHRTQMNESPD